MNSNFKTLKYLAIFGGDGNAPPMLSTFSLIHHQIDMDLSLIFRAQEWMYPTSRPLAIPQKTDMQMHTQKDALEKVAPFKSVPRCSMYGIFIYLHLASIYGINVGQYFLIFQSHGACGYVEFRLCMSNLPESSNVQ